MFLVGVVPAVAWPFGNKNSGKGDGEREFRALASAETNVFVTLAAQREQRTVELALFGRLVREKRAELALFDASLQRKYGMDPKKVYTFNPTNRTISLVVTKTPEKGKDGKAPVPVVEQLPHRVFPDEVACDKFMEVVVAKRMTVRQIEVLDELAREKTIELSKVASALQERFGISPSGNYRYDAKTRKIFEKVVPASGRMPTPQEVRAPFEKPKAAAALPAARPAVQPAARPAVQPAAK
jgi:hypothetical protein